ncbi:MAG: hypothetical protein ACYC09_14935 [Bacteroidota bacterium]
MQLIDALDMILAEHARSVHLHGDWQNYTVDQMMAEIINKLMMEAGEAAGRLDLHGEHGMVRELSQVAACCIKAMMVLSDRPDGTLAQTSRTAGAHPGLRGRSPLASLYPPQREDSPINRPIEEGL